MDAVPLKPIYILTPHWIRTGGPEAQHQLSDALIEQGFDARLVYYVPGDISGVGEENGRIVPWLGIPKQFPDYAAPSFEEYARYRINLVRSIDCSKPCVIVLSETLAHLTPLFPAHVTVLIWWLSVDNGFDALSKVNLNHLRKPNVKHVAQSQYARRVVEALGLGFAGMLSDYTVDLSEYAAPLPSSDRPKLAAFATGRKVIADLDAIISEIAALDPEIECVKIENFSRPQMAELFARARVYVDLGNFPGKDRGPREAASMGCAPLVRADGAGFEATTSLWLPDTNPCAVASAVVTEMRVRNNWRPWIGVERAQFTLEVNAVFNGL